MNDLTLTITDLKAKVEKLVTLHQQLKQDNELLTVDNTILKETVEGHKLTIETLEKNNLDLLQSKNEEHNNVITDTKVKINELVQEIDNCIALLK